MVNYNYITTTGVIVPDTSELLSDIQGEFAQALGSNLILDPATPQGLLITAETSARESMVGNNVAVANQINPNLAAGVFLDAICALTGLVRVAGTNSSINGVLLSGVPSTVVPAGVQAQTTNGDIFTLLNAVVLNAQGTATGQFVSAAIGPIPATVGSLNQIITNVLGWENITNPVAAVLGVNEQSDLSLRTLRKNTLALQGVSISEAITSALYNVAGVTSLAYRENYTNASKIINGISLLPNSIYACVDGGANTDIATALLANKSAGSNWNGNTTVNVVDPASGQSYPVKFQRPTAIQILIKITVKAASATSDPTLAVQQAISDYANGLIDGEPGFVVGGNVSPFEIAGAVNNEAPGIYVQNVQVSTVGGTYAASEIAIGINQVARIMQSNIQVILA